MKTILKNPFYKVAGFFILYLLLMASIVYGVMNSNITTGEKRESSSSSQKVEEFFSEEIKLYEKSKGIREEEESDKWRPSNRFVMIALTLSSILDIIIVLLWARHENMKREEHPEPAKPRLTDQKWFWKIVAMGIVQPKNNKLVMNWRNLVLIVTAMYLMKKAIVDRL
jgi:hypothetical protein